MVFFLGHPTWCSDYEARRMRRAHRLDYAGSQRRDRKSCQSRLATARRYLFCLSDLTKESGMIEMIGTMPRQIAARSGVETSFVIGYSESRRLAPVAIVAYVGGTRQTTSRLIETDVLL